jgi:hypothetical protein
MTFGHFLSEVPVQESSEGNASGGWVIRIGRELAMFARFEGSRLGWIFLNGSNHFAAPKYLSHRAVFPPAINPNIWAVASFIQLQTTVLIPVPHWSFSPFGPGWHEHSNLVDIQASSEDSRNRHTRPIFIPGNSPA